MDLNPLQQLDAELRTYFVQQFGADEGDDDAAFVAFQPGGLPLTAATLPARSFIRCLRP